MDLSDPETQLRVWLASALGTSDELYRVLEQEAHALPGRNPILLQAISSSKERLVDELVRLTNELIKLCDSAQISDVSAELRFPLLVRRLVREPASVSDLLSGWEKLCQSGKTCQRLNNQNGSYIGLARRHAQQALDVLYHGSGQTRTYGPDGLTQNFRESPRSVASA